MVLNLRRFRYFLLIGLFLLGLLPLIKATLIHKVEPPPPEPPKAQNCGEYLVWQEVNKLFPKYAQAKIVDYDTGMIFQVQRRGGSNHADVQPLTAEDTATMKSIYGGQWSWQRRAILLQLENGRKIAASMNGMPHGQGNIRGNRFNGHFCIHFRNSKTHGSRKVDLPHQIMVRKAAQVLDQYLLTLTPEESLRVFFAALDQRDQGIALKLLHSPEGLAALLENLGRIEYVKIDRVKPIDDRTFNVSLRVFFARSSKEMKKELPITLIKNEHGWQIEAVSLEPLFGG